MLRCPILLGIGRDQIPSVSRLRPCALPAGHRKSVEGKEVTVCRDHFTSNAPMELYESEGWDSEGYSESFIGIDLSRAWDLLRRQ